MQTVKGLREEIRQLQSRINAENRSAERERGKADDYRHDDDLSHAQSHTDTALQHEQNAVDLQHEINNRMAAMEDIQQQIADLDQQKTEVMSQRDAEIKELDQEIARLNG